MNCQKVRGEHKPVIFKSEALKEGPHSPAISAIRLTARCIVFASAHQLFLQSSNNNNQKAVTRGRTDHFSNIIFRPTVIYLQFPIRVCFSAAVGHLISCSTLVYLIGSLICDLDLRT